MPSLMQGLSQNLPRLRKQKGLSQAQLADAVGASRGTIAKYETGVGGATVDMIAKLARALGVEETDLVHSQKEVTHSEYVEIPKSQWNELIQALTAIPARNDLWVRLRSLSPDQQKIVWTASEDLIASLEKKGKKAKK